MAVWLVRAGKHGEHEQFALDNGVVLIGWQAMPDLSKVKAREEVDAAYQKAYPGAGTGRRANHVGQFWAFVHRIQAGDLVVLPGKRGSTIAIGKVTGPYKYRKDIPDSPHTRPVEWLQKEIPRTKFEQDLLYTLGSAMTVCQVERNNAEVRIRALVEGKTPPVVEPNGGEEIPDIEQVARDQITKFIERRFKGHDMARLVEAVLLAEGYLTQRSDPGPDGGADILAGTGPLGFSPPRLCVQVKSQQSAADLSVFQALKGAMQTFGAEQGLLVCWGGFNRVVLSESRRTFFGIRLWDADDLVEAIFRSYDKLSDELKAELPLKRTWALVQEEDE